MARGTAAAALAMVALLVGAGAFIFAARPDVVSQPEVSTTCAAGQVAQNESAAGAFQCAPLPIIHPKQIQQLLNFSLTSDVSITSTNPNAPTSIMNMTFTKTFSNSTIQVNGQITGLSTGAAQGLVVWISDQIGEPTVSRLYCDAGIGNAVTNQATTVALSCTLRGLAAGSMTIYLVGFEGNGAGGGTIKSLQLSSKLYATELTLEELNI